MSKLPVSVIMLTFNEGYHLLGAIENIKDWAERVFVLDSLSTDNTVEIALKNDVSIVQRPFINFGDQWNFALDNLPVMTDWTFKLDPDERVTSALVAEMRRITESKNSCDGYFMPRRLWFMGSPLHVKADVLRLWKTGKCQFSDVLVNEHPLIDGRIGHLKGIVEHHDSPNLHHWFEKQNLYTTMEAIMKARGDPLATKARLFGNRLQRRMFFKTNFSKIPFRFQILYLYELLLRGAWRSGQTGFAWARLRVEIMRTIELKAKEISIKARIPELPRLSHGDYDPRVKISSLQKSVMKNL